MGEPAHNTQNSRHETVWNDSIISIITLNVFQIYCIKHAAKKSPETVLFLISEYCKCTEHMLGISFIFCICKISNLYQQKPQRQHRSCPREPSHCAIKLLTPLYHFWELSPGWKGQNDFHNSGPFSLPIYDMGLQTHTQQGLFSSFCFVRMCHSLLKYILKIKLLYCFITPRSSFVKSLEFVPICYDLDYLKIWVY